MEYPILDQLNNREDLLRLTPDQDKTLCQEIRRFLVESVSKTGGHLASNLGIVELTLAIHKVFDTSVDRLVFDVGHQAYVHKLLTGRREGFASLRQLDGISGFPKPNESVHDAAIAGHASSAISVALGMMRARSLQNQNYQVIALLGDGALTGGLAYEALNDAGVSGEPLIVILNDNGMSISPNVGGMSRHLANVRLKPRYYTIKRAYRRVINTVPGGKRFYRFTHNVKKRFHRAMLGTTMFEEMGFSYLGPVGGHDIKRCVEILNIAREMNGPVLVHVMTVKGKGYGPAEENPDVFHGVSCFDVQTGAVKESDESFSDAFGEAMTELAEADKRICAITAAMPSGTGLCGFAEKFPDRFYDVGIAEAHAAAMAAGLALGGQLPVFAVYSTFLQRAFDQLIHDIAISGAHVVLGVDRAGLVGADGETHQGTFDVGFLRQVPGMTILCPASNQELKRMLRSALYDYTGPVAVRYPRGGQQTDLGEGDLLREGGDVTLAAYGTMCQTMLKTADLLAEQGIRAEVVRFRCIQPLDLDQIRASYQKTGLLLIAEDCVETGCVGQALCTQLSDLPGRILLKNHGLRFVPHGTVEQLHARLGLDPQSLADLAARAVGEKQ